MKHGSRVVGLLSLSFVLLFVSQTAGREASKRTILGTAISPAHFPRSSSQDLEEFFTLAAEIGSHVALITEWKHQMPIPQIAALMELAGSRGLQFHLSLSPIALEGGRSQPAIPSHLTGKSFSDPDVRSAFQARALELAALEPDLLGLGTEVNLLAQNPNEFKAYVSLLRETVKEIKRNRLGQKVTVSFQWDVVLTQKQFDVLPYFRGMVDVYSFTTYPSFFGSAGKLPGDYYTSVRKLLPRETIGFSEVGWNSELGSNEEEQARYYSRLPKLMRGAGPEFITLALLHDATVFTGELASLNSVGVRRNDGTPKKSWKVIKNLQF